MSSTLRTWRHTDRAKVAGHLVYEDGVFAHIRVVGDHRCVITRGDGTGTTEVVTYADGQHASLPLEWWDDVTPADEPEVA